MKEEERCASQHEGEGTITRSVLSHLLSLDTATLECSAGVQLCDPLQVRRRTVLDQLLLEKSARPRKTLALTESASNASWRVARQDARHHGWVSVRFGGNQMR
eukprot:scaffold1316_cov130-Isochrysis_galbana.AAC.13